MSAVAGDSPIAQIKTRLVLKENVAYRKYQRKINHKTVAEKICRNSRDCRKATDSAVECLVGRIPWRRLRFLFCDNLLKAPQMPPPKMVSVRLCNVLIRALS